MWAWAHSVAGALCSARHERDAGRADARRDGTSSAQLDSRHTIPETWVTTSTRTRRSGVGVGGHEVSKPRVIVIRWSAERIGPTIIAAPQRGHAHVPTVGVAGHRRRASPSCGAALRSVRARAMRVAATGVGEKARLPDADEAARQNVLDEAAQKLHR